MDKFWKSSENSKRKRQERSENEIEDQEEKRDGEEKKIRRKESGREMEKAEEIVHEKDGGGGRSLEKNGTVWTSLLLGTKTEDKPAEEPGGQIRKLKLNRRLRKD